MSSARQPSTPADASGLFITGTDTGVGKTLLSAGIIRALRNRGRRVLGMKPVASGASIGAEGLRNEDALALQAAGSLVAPYAQINPFVFEPPIAPHIAAAEAGVEVRLEVIAENFRKLAALAETVVVEGVGGWLVPFDEEVGVPELARALGLPIVLVVEMRLGCLNHAQLSARAIRESGCTLGAWVANDGAVPMERLAENMSWLHRHLPAPCLGHVPRLAQPEASTVSRYLDVDLLTSLV